MNNLDLFHDAGPSPAAIARHSAIVRRDEGMGRVERRASRVAPEWSATALAALREFLKLQGDEPFLAEWFRTWVESNTRLAPPPDGRAWGPLMKAAQSAGLVESCGYAPAYSSNLSPKVLWRAGSRGARL